MALISIRKLQKIYRVGTERVNALRGVDLDIQKNEFVAIMGQSGSGKSTLMNVLGCLDRPTSGSYELNNFPTHKMNAGQLATVRNTQIGFVFQSFELLNRATALDNVMLPLIYSPRNWFGARKRAAKALERVGLANRMDHKPNQLSGGQRQRVAIARALVNEPSLVLADEPTGNLDSRTSLEIIELFKALHNEGQTIVIVTHEEDIAGHAKRIVRLRDGLVWSDHPTERDPIHQQYLQSMFSVAQTAFDAAAQARTTEQQEQQAVSQVATAPTTPSTPKGDPA
jgi:putative ABC transport system ATP-binding protein